MTLGRSSVNRGIPFAFNSFVDFDLQDGGHGASSTWYADLTANLSWDINSGVGRDGRRDMFRRQVAISQHAPHHYMGADDVNDDRGKAKGCRGTVGGEKPYNAHSAQPSGNPEKGQYLRGIKQSHTGKRTDGVHGLQP